MEVLASEAAVKTFEKPKAIEFINSYNQLSAGERNESICFAPDHYGYMTGEEAGKVVSKTIEEALRLKAILYETFRRNAADIDTAAREITSKFYGEMPGYFIAPEILEGVFKRIFKYIAKTPESRPD